jgi:hypothetical protein
MGPSAQKPWRKKGADIDPEDVREVRRAASFSLLFVSLVEGLLEGAPKFERGFWSDPLPDQRRMTAAVSSGQDAYLS